MDFTKELKELDQMHDPSQVEMFDKVPFGTYQAKLDSIRLEKSKSSDRLQTHMSFEIVSGPHEGRSIDKFCGMETEQGLDFLVRDIYRLYGKKKSFRWEELEKVVFPELIDSIVEINTKENKKDPKYTDIFINKKIDTIATSSDLDTPSKTADDDLPF